MSTRTSTLLIVLVILAAGLAGLLLWNRLPDPMASHWGADDQVNGFAPRVQGVLLLPLMTAGLAGLFLLIPHIDPLKQNIQAFRGTFNLFTLLFTLFMLYIHALTLAWNLGLTGFRMSAAMTPAAGLLFILIGSMLGKARRNYFIGIRTPWTLSSDRVWDETHRLGGRLFMAAGAITLAGVFFPTQAMWFLIVPLIGVTVISVVYSYLSYRREPGD